MMAGKEKKMALLKEHIPSSGGAGRAGKRSSSQGRLPMFLVRKGTVDFLSGRVTIWA